MPLQSSGPISLNDIHVELGATSGTTVSLNDADVRALGGFNSTEAVPVAEFYGISAYTSPLIPTSAISDLSSYAAGSGALQINDGVTSTVFTDTSYSVQGSWTNSVSFNTEAGRDIIFTFIIKDRDSTDIDRFYMNNRNTLDLTWTAANAVLTTISGAIGTPIKRTANSPIHETTSTNPSLSPTAVIFDSIQGDLNEIYQCSIKFTNIQTGHIGTSPDLMFTHEDNEDDSRYVRVWKINLT